jgi:hypothetical protein
MMVDADGKEYANAGELSDANIADYLRTLSNIVDGNSTFLATKDSSYVPKHASAKRSRVNARGRQDGCM